MSNSISETVAGLGQTLPPASTPVANFISTTRIGNILYISGQVGLVDGKPSHVGLLGRDFTVEQGREAACIAGCGVLAQIAAVTGDTISAVGSVARLGVFVAATEDFTQHPQVANGASDLIVAVFGEAGRHARTAVGVSSLPLGVAVEIDAIVELEA